MRLGIFIVMVGRRAGGLETYERELVRALAALDTKHELHLFCTHQVAVETLRLESKPNVRQHVLWPSMRWISLPVSLPVALARARVDLLHATFVPPPLSPTDYVFTMHDTSTIALPESYPTALRMRTNALMSRGVRKARLVICVSQDVSDHVAEHWRLPPERLAVAYHGVPSHFRPMDETAARRFLRETYGLERPYVLSVGRIEQRKNLVRVLEAFHHLRQQGVPDLQLVLIGRREWPWPEFDETLARLRLADHVKELGFFNHQDLPVFYSAAEMLAFPSLWEGFGLPLVEAMACGCPVVTSNVTCLPEIAGGAAVLVDPRSVPDLVGAMHRVLTDREFRATLRTRGLERARDFTWERTAQQTLAAYERARARR